MQARIAVPAESSRQPPIALIDLLCQARLLHTQMRWAQLEELCLRILAQEPRHAETLFLLGISLRAQNRPQPAIRMFERAIHGSPRVPIYHTYLAVALHDLNRLEEAEAAYSHALALEPEQPEALCGMGSLLCARKQTDTAIEMLEHACALRPDYGEAWNNLAIALRSAHRLEEAIPCLERAAAISPGDPEVLTNLSHALCDTGHYRESMAAAKHALALDPNLAKAHHVLSSASYHAGDLRTALRHGHRALKLEPEHIHARMNLGMMRLLLGDYARGWRDFSIRDHIHPLRSVSQPRWKGEPIAGQRLLLLSEQGMGDMIQCLRYIERVAETGAEILVELPQRLLRLAAELPGVAQCVETSDPLPEFDCYLPMFQLPEIFETTVETIPNQVPYLRIPEAARRKAEQIDWISNGLRVGMCWTGSPKHGENALRSIRLSALEPLLELPGVHFYSLQMGPGAEQLEPYRDQIVDLAPYSDDMADTAAQMEHLDLVVTIDTSVAHLAGALGRPVWVLLNALPDWRWMLDRSDSPWYPTARLFRQRQQGDWDAVIEDLQHALEQLAPMS
jgi:tetratricopeptide (TPR) repeat protein